MALGAMAQATSRIRLGPLVSSNTFRHPAILAKMAKERGLKIEEDADGP